jgi:hypothetical protein
LPSRSFPPRHWLRRPPSPRRRPSKPQRNRRSLLPAVEAAFKAAHTVGDHQQRLEGKRGRPGHLEVESVDRGLHRDLNYKADGTVIDMEEEVAEADFPASVAAAIKTRYPKATVAKREKLTKGATVSYEIQLKGGPGEVVLTPDGKWISPKAKS